ncbi:hypothetical protein AvCA_29040 [Azotobacter vinelandii CA]|uniref:Uncharacterized protein n=2 Tax=Azotobacter vinelandii TaxID=354 RepID=C1DLY6_AZOVD|nr:hypothetical protein Avin_29040 [Azotobacter vinelandii DJ]AGK14819.1 hypothetical protein AvCA_29040 [Azotobacter vinelandii CA]AGK20944.1 hypothetical protein AvCA6_29040 [Azotobacter vinelandii CA6]
MSCNHLVPPVRQWSGIIRTGRGRRDRSSASPCAGGGTGVSISKRRRTPPGPSTALPLLNKW